ncbi:MAG: hypothetical protein K2X38_10460 [Gemmataceae bacterium]|nr:hypothetical protein [Gemmataceae bacterium]
MLRNVLCAFVLLALSLGLAMAESVKGRITKIDGGKVTVEGIGAKKGEKGESKTFDLAKDVKVSKKDKKETIPLEGGLKNEALKDLGAKGVGATLEVNDNKVTEIIVSEKKKK